jgi:hypothetical protein
MNSSPKFKGLLYNIANVEVNDVFTDVRNFHGGKLVNKHFVDSTFLFLVLFITMLYMFEVKIVQI